MAVRGDKGTGLSAGVQLCYLLLFGLGVLGALGQRGHPALVMGVLAGLAPLGILARLPRGWFPGWLRQVVQILIAGCGVAWWRLRTGSAPADVIIVESSAVLGSALAVGGVRREYGLLGCISLILIGFGGLVPGRTLYLPVVCLYLGVGVLLMYETRTANLAAAAETGPGEPSPRPPANWGYRLAHLALCCAGTLALAGLFPLPHGRSAGLIPVGYYTPQELAFPLSWRQWLRPAMGMLPWGEPSEGMENGSGGAEVSEDPRGQLVLPGLSSTRSLDAREGGGGAALGTDLVMRVQAPAKLYWLVQLYDRYDGDTWSASAQLRQPGSVLDRGPAAGWRRIDQYVNLEKPPGNRLPAAYRVVQCEWAFPAAASGEGDRPSPPIGVDLSSPWFAGRNPRLPWQYHAVSQVPTLDAVAPVAGAGFPGADFDVYRQLPEGRISARVRRLAATLTAGLDTPLARAMALQDYLREHYAYTLTPRAIPPDAEAVDFFLFESREGYCQHFAQALTVLARCAGLPARLATGYSPGTYNLLTNCFEVYEYHAHAWTQIRIEPYGWLTFDGVAPGRLRLETRPGLLRQLMDPFPRDWSARPPELSLRGSGRGRRATPGRTGTEQGPVARTLQEVYSRAVRESADGRASPGALARAAGALLREWLAEQWDRLREAVAEWAADAWGRVLAAFARAWHAVSNLSMGAYAAAGVAAALLAVLWGRRRLALAVIGTALQRWLCARQWRRLGRALDGDPAAAVRAANRLLRQVMALGRFTRPANLDAEEYARWLTSTEPAIAADYQAVARVLHQVAYREIPPSRGDAQAVLDAVGRILAEIDSRLTLTGVRRRAGPGFPP